MISASVAAVALVSYFVLLPFPPFILNLDFQGKEAIAEMGRI